MACAGVALKEFKGALMQSLRLCVSLRATVRQGGPCTPSAGQKPSLRGRAPDPAQRRSDPTLRGLPPPGPRQRPL